MAIAVAAYRAGIITETILDAIIIVIFITSTLASLIVSFTGKRLHGY
ncbi:hypothetical protein QA601_03785 [Chitinispirillales bacterium ANBcel5]|nr:hypothetical protein [Chitinispirillales bacterium ANBcel5]